MRTLSALTSTKHQFYIHQGSPSASRLRLLTEHPMRLIASFLPHGWTEGFSFQCLLGYLTLLSRNIQMKKPQCYYNCGDVKHLHMTSRHLALFETCRIQGCSFSFSKHAMWQLRKHSLTMTVPKLSKQEKVYTLQIELYKNIRKMYCVRKV